MSSARIVRIGLLDACRFQRQHHYNEANIEAIAADLTEGSRAILNPVHVIPKAGGRWELVAGHDRVEAAKRAGFSDVPARDFDSLLRTGEEIYEHWRRDNVLRKQPDREAAAAETLLEWRGAWTDRRVATVCGVSHPTVAKIRTRLEAEGRLEKVSNREGADGKQYKPKKRTGTSDPKDRKPSKAAAEREKAAAQSGAEHEAEREAPEGGKGAATPEVQVKRDAGQPDQPGARSPETQDVGTTADDADDLSAGAVPDRLTSTSPSEARESVEAPVVATSDVPPAPSQDPAVVEVVPDSAVVTVLASLPDYPSAPTTDDVAPLTKADVDRLLSFGRWCQMVAARWALLQKQTAAA